MKKKWVMNLTSGLIGALISYVGTLGYQPMKNFVVNVKDETLLTLALFALFALYVELRIRGLRKDLETKIAELSQEGRKKRKKSRKRGK